MGTKQESPGIFFRNPHPFWSFCFEIYPAKKQPRTHPKDLLPLTSQLLTKWPLARGTDERIWIFDLHQIGSLVFSLMPKLFLYTQHHGFWLVCENSWWSKSVSDVQGGRVEMFFFQSEQMWRWCKMMYHWIKETTLEPWNGNFTCLTRMT